MKKTTSKYFSIGGVLLIASLCLFFDNVYDGYRAEQSAQSVVEKWENEINSSKKRHMQSVLIDGDYYIGKLNILPLNLTLPVMEDWDYDKLKKAPCRYMGFVYDNMIIMAHNYPKHFGSLHKLNKGDDILFEDVKGRRFYYKVDKVETLSSTDVDEVEDGDWDLSLFTCTIGGRNRITVRCFKIEKDKK